MTSMMTNKSIAKGKMYISQAQPTKSYTIENALLLTEEHLDFCNCCVRITT
jgi:hypothetical protein